MQAFSFIFFLGIVKLKENIKNLKFFLFGKRKIKIKRLKKKCSLCCRCWFRVLCWSPLLVLHCVLWTEQSSRGDLSCLSALADGGWLYWPLQLGAILPGPALQHQQNTAGGNDETPYRLVVVNKK